MSVWQWTQPWASCRCSCRASWESWWASPQWDTGPSWNASQHTYQPCVAGKLSPCLWPWCNPAGEIITIIHCHTTGSTHFINENRWGWSHHIHVHYKGWHHMGASTTIRDWGQDFDHSNFNQTLTTPVDRLESLWLFPSCPTISRSTIWPALKFCLDHLTSLWPQSRVEIVTYVVSPHLINSCRKQLILSCNFVRTQTIRYMILSNNFLWCPLADIIDLHEWILTARLMSFTWTSSALHFPNSLISTEGVSTSPNSSVAILTYNKN